MKKSKLFSGLVLSLLGLAVMMLMARCSNGVYAQNKLEDEASVTRAVEEQRYVFRAQTMMPSSGRMRNLTSNYDLTVTKDSVSSWLPYFGRAYSAPLDPTKGGIQFISTKFDYTTSPINDGWEITIKPKDTRDVQELFLTIYKNGNANLRVTSISRQPISFGGFVAAKNQ
jgi:hypothetical protein